MSQPCSNTFFTITSLHSFTFFMKCFLLLVYLCACVMLHFCRRPLPCADISRATFIQLSLYLARRHFEGGDNSTCGDISRKYGNRQLTRTPECSSSDYYYYSFSARLAPKRQQLRRRFQSKDVERSAGYCTCTPTNRQRPHIVCKLEKAAFTLTLM